MAGVLNVDTLKADSNLRLQIASANVAFIDVNGLTIVGNSLNVGGGRIVVTSNNSISTPTVIGANLVTATGTTALGITANGQITTANAPFILTGGQLQFPGTQIASADANTLDDYEEGTWTPTVARTGSSYTFANRVGTYTKIGRQITAQCYTNITAIATQGSGYITVTGLPFACMSLTGVAFAGPVFYNTLSSTSATMSVGVFNNETFVYLKSTTRTEDPISENTTTGYLMFTITYFTN
jgi:hypothetical protein